MSANHSFRMVYGTASVLAAITAIGLLVALFGDGAWDAMSWVALAIPLIVILWKMTLARLRSS